MVFNEILRFNVSLGDLNIDDEKIKEILVKLKLEPLLEKSTLDEPLNVRMLSGGEKARIALARVLAKDSELILLDEFSSNLDIETQNLIREYLLNSNKTFIEISHTIPKFISEYSHIYKLENYKLKLK